MRFAIFGNPSPAKVLGCEQELLSLIQSLGNSYLIESSYFDFLTNTVKLEINPAYRLEGTDFQADVVISIGGDGTLLRTAARIGVKGIPMVGINSGRLGFLADITADHMEQAIRMIHQGQYTLQERHLLQLSMAGIPYGHTPYALNDIAILKHDISSMISIATSIDNTPLITYQADGLVVATPTGSTAYSLSVGGPIVAPGAQVNVLTPVAPHSLTMRPIVLPNDRTISLDVSSRSHSFLISIDGNSFSCHEHTPLEVTQAPFSIKLIRLQDSDFYSTLRQKMLWGTDSRK